MWGVSMKECEKTYNIALVGNPNVGKSTIFNSFTGMHQHTGNWPGKTVENTQGEYVYNKAMYIIQDLPGTYSLNPNSAEEEVTCDYIKEKNYDALVIILDASCLLRNIRFALQILQYSQNAVLCINLIDEAQKKGIDINVSKLSELLNVPVIPTAARSGVGMKELKSTIESIVENKGEKKQLESDKNIDIDTYSNMLFEECCTLKNNTTDGFDRKVDRILISKGIGIPVMLLIMVGIFWLTIVGANYPSEMLSNLFSNVGDIAKQFLISIKCPELIISALIDGVYTTLTWIISVMLPPMPRYNKNRLYLNPSINYRYYNACTK